MKCDEFQRLIDAYLKGTIDESLREQFEEHFFQCRKCFLGLKINETLLNGEVSIPVEEQPHRFSFKVLRPVLAMAALFFLVLSSVLLMRHSQQLQKLKELSRFDLPPYHQGEMRGGDRSGPLLEKEFSQAMRSFQERDFRSTLKILDRPSFATAGYPKYDFFRAISLLGTGEAERAGKILDSIIQSMDPAYFDEAIYYKGFVLLRQGKRRQALAQFEKLANMLSPMAAKARIMVQKIKE